jgi:hypothetical protein
MDMNVTFYKCDCHSFTLYLSYATLHHTLLDVCKYLMMQSSLWQMVRTRVAEEQLLDIQETSAGHGRGQEPHDNAPPPPPPRPLVSLEQLLATQNNLMRLPATPTTRQGFLILGLFGDSPSTLLRGD